MQIWAAGTVGPQRRLGCSQVLEESPAVELTALEFAYPVPIPPPGAPRFSSGEPTSLSLSLCGFTHTWGSQG